MLAAMSEPWPERDQETGNRDEQPPRPPLTTEEKALVFRAQLILFIVMGLFIVVPFVVWWLLSRGK